MPTGTKTGNGKMQFDTSQNIQIVSILELSIMLDYIL